MDHPSLTRYRIAASWRFPLEYHFVDVVVKRGPVVEAVGSDPPKPLSGVPTLKL